MKTVKNEWFGNNVLSKADLGLQVNVGNVIGKYAGVKSMRIKE